MKLVYEDMFLPAMPRTIPTGGFLGRAIVGHWTAGNPGRAGAVATAQWMAGDGRARNASYHDIVWFEPGSETVGVLRTVRKTEFSHSINPNRPPWLTYSGEASRRAQEDAGFALIRGLLGDMWWNPNEVVRSVSFAGMPGDLERAMRSPWFVQCMAKICADIKAEEPSMGPRPIFTHGEGQPSTRYDWGTELRPAIYRLWDQGLPDTATEGVMEQVKFRVEPWTAGPNGARAFDRIGGQVVHHFPAGTPLVSVFEREDGRWRYVLVSDSDKRGYPVPRGDLVPVQVGGYPEETRTYWNAIRQMPKMPLGGDTTALAMENDSLRLDNAGLRKQLEESLAAEAATRELFNEALVLADKIAALDD